MTRKIIRVMNQEMEKVVFMEGATLIEGELRKLKRPIQTLPISHPEQLPSTLASAGTCALWTELLMFRKPYWSAFNEIKLINPQVRVVLFSLLPSDDFIVLPGFVPPDFALPLFQSEDDLRSCWDQIRNGLDFSSHVQGYCHALKRILTARERLIFYFYGQGLAPREIKTILGISVRTVDTHRENVRRKLRVATSSEMVQLAFRWNSSREGGTELCRRLQNLSPMKSEE